MAMGYLAMLQTQHEPVELRTIGDQSNEVGKSNETSQKGGEETVTIDENFEHTNVCSQRRSCDRTANYGGNTRALSVSRSRQFFLLTCM